MLQFDSIEKILFIAIGTVVLIIIIITFVCSMDPRCFCYSRIRKKGRKKEDGINSLNEGTYKHGYEMFTSDILRKQEGSIISNASTKRDSCYSSMSDTSEGILSNTNSCNKSLTAIKGTVSRAPSLECKDYFGEIILKFLYVLNETEHTGKIFIMIQNWHVALNVYDDDKYGNPTELGCTDFPLKHAIDPNGQEIIYKCCLAHSTRNLGNMLLSLNYLPTAERIVVQVHKVSNLKIDKYETVAFQVHVLLLSGMGRVLKRKKISSKHENDQLIFDEVIPFTISNLPLSTLTCLLLLCAKTSEEGSFTHDSINEEKHTRENNKNQNTDREDQSKRNFKATKENCIGKVFLGTTVRVPEGQNHWYATLQRPRTSVSMWHKLR